MIDDDSSAHKSNRRARLQIRLRRTYSPFISITRPPGRSCANLFIIHSFAVIQRTLLLFGFECRERLDNVEVGFRVGELFELLDLQTPIFVGDDLSD